MLTEFLYCVQMRAELNISTVENVITKQRDGIRDRQRPEGGGKIRYLAEESSELDSMMW